MQIHPQALPGIKIEAFAALNQAGFAAQHAPHAPWPGGFAPDAPDFSWDHIFPTPCPRFERMDKLCKWVVAAVEFLNPTSLLPMPERRETALLLATTFGSWQTDVSFLKSLRRPGGASPMLFAYTLPSAAIGEACIRYALRGPIQCFSSAYNQTDLLLQETAAILQSCMAEACIAVFADTEGACAWLARPDAKNTNTGFACGATRQNR